MKKSGLSLAIEKRNSSPEILTGQNPDLQSEELLKQQEVENEIAKNLREATKKALESVNLDGESIESPYSNKATLQSREATANNSPQIAKSSPKASVAKRSSLSSISEESEPLVKENPLARTI